MRWSRAALVVDGGRIRRSCRPRAWRRVPSTSTATGCCRAWSSCTPTISSASSRRGPGVRWPAQAAMLAHDAQIAAAGITTVCDAVCVGIYGGKRERHRVSCRPVARGAAPRRSATGRSRPSISCICAARSSDPHVVELFEPLMEEPALQLVSFMDHTPGQRQWHDIDKFRDLPSRPQRGLRGGVPGADRAPHRGAARSMPTGTAQTLLALVARPADHAREPRRHHGRACRGGRGRRHARSRSSRPRIAAAEAARARAAWAW